MKPSRRSLWGLAALVLAIGVGQQAWTGWQQGRLGERLAALARPGDIRMLSSTTCVFCKAARQWMAEHRVAFSECFIDTDADCAARFDAVRGSGTPVLLVRGQAQLGFAPERVLEALQRLPAKPAG